MLSEVFCWCKMLEPNISGPIHSHKISMSSAARRTTPMFRVRERLHDVMADSCQNQRSPATKRIGWFRSATDRTMSPCGDSSAKFRWKTERSGWNSLFTPIGFHIFTYFHHFQRIICVRLCVSIPSFLFLQLLNSQIFSVLRSILLWCFWPQRHWRFVLGESAVALWRPGSASRRVMPSTRVRNASEKLIWTPSC